MSIATELQQLRDNVSSLISILSDKGVDVSESPGLTNLVQKVNELDSKGLFSSLVSGSISSVTIPEGVDLIKSGAFWSCSLLSVVVPDSVISINERAFEHCENLTSITIPNSVTTLGRLCFSGCYRLQSVILSNRLTELSPSVFQYCRALTSMTIPSSVTTISSQAFDGCTNLSSITIPNSIQSSIGLWSFNGCTSLEFVTLESGFNADHLDLSSSTLYSTETILSWINALYDRTGLDAYTLTIGSTNLAKLTEEQIAIATSKNWTLA